MRKLLCVLSFAVAVIASPASAAEQGIASAHVFKNSSGGYDLLRGVALNATAANRTITLDLRAGRDGGRYSKARIFVFFTYGAATTVTAQMTCSLDGTNYGRRTSRSTSSGTSTVYLQSDSYTTGGASANLVLEYDIRGCSKVQVLLGGAGAGASDLVNTQAVAVAGE